MKRHATSVEMERIDCPIRQRPSRTANRDGLTGFKELHYLLFPIRGESSAIPNAGNETSPG